MRSTVFALLFVAAAVFAGTWYVAVYQKPPVPGRMLPRHPSTVKVGVAELTDALEHGPWVSPGLKGKRIYKLGFRTCPDCIRWDKTEMKAYHDAGIDTREIIYARAKDTPAIKAVTADLACTREWTIYERWMADVPEAYTEKYGMPPAPETDQRRTACLQWGQIVHDRVKAVMKQNGWALEVPALFWRAPNGDWRVFLGDDHRAKREIRRELGVPLD